MAITTAETPIKAATKAATKTEDPTRTTAELDAERVSPKESSYTVLAGSNESGPFTVVKGSPFTVVGGQRAARLAAVEANPEIRSAILAGEGPWLVAVAKWAPKQAGVTQLDPKLDI